MRISTKDWVKYINRLSELNQTASEEMTAWIQRNGFGNREALLDYAYALVTKYGEGSASLAAEMYDVTMEMEGAFYPAAVPAPTATYDETAKAMNGTLKRSRNPSYVGATVGRLVKMAGADTTIKNAIRDGVEWAWIPHGDTCPFCITLASRGWQQASAAVLKGNHAEHIHSNCDCTFAIRSATDTTYDAYDPDRYLEMYENAEGNSWQEKVNSMRRIDYAKNKEQINARKRAAYADRKKLLHKGRGYDVTKDYLDEAIPGRGLIDYEDGFDKKNRKDEIETAKIIHERLGGSIVLKTEKDGQKNPDYEWMDSLWDLKSTTTIKAANSAIKSGMEQIRKNPGGIILNYGKSFFPIDEIIKVIDKRMQWYPDECADIMVIMNGEIVKILRY